MTSGYITALRLPRCDHNDIQWAVKHRIQPGTSESWALTADCYFLIIVYWHLIISPPELASRPHVML
jgi:hypothetical protein